jgi:CRISPR-associated endonuclease Cas3-HD
MNFCAHTAEDESGRPLPETSGRWQPLIRHLQGVARLAREFGTALDLEAEARLAGWLHDLGKYRDEFQAYLRGQRAGSLETRHAIYGAAWALQHEFLGLLFSVAGHHAGLHDKDQVVSDAEKSTVFRLLYQLSVPDVCEIQQHREQLRFEQVSKLFNFIEADTVPLVVVEQYNPETRSNEPVPLKEDPSRTVKQLLDTATDRAPQFLTPTEWRLLQPHIVSLSHRDKRTAPFVAGNARLVLRGDDPRRGLYRLVSSSLYAGTLHGAGLHVSEQFGNFDYLL